MSKLIRLSKLILKHRSLINKSNIEKAYRYLRKGEVTAGVRRIYRKLESFESKIEKTEEKSFLNDFLYCKDLPVIQEKVDVIVPIYNAYEYTVKCIESVYRNTDVAYNLYLINDSSTDERIKTYLNTLKLEAKPQHLHKLTIINHQKNLGFIGTINEGFSLSENHVVILNTDTEVPSGWLTRLLNPILEDKRIASVTPFSNCATICSFPEFCQDNILPRGISLSELDELFSKYGSKNFIEIPTGVGFCMAINRKCLKKIGTFDTVFGKGYCEENDWCRRAVKAGFKNVMVTNLFVYHKHGASFGEVITKSKQERIEENLLILSKKHPGYQEMIDKFILKDPAKDIRNFMNLVVARYVDRRHYAELAINHSIGGGATVYLQRKIEKEKDKLFFVMELLEDRTTLHIKMCNANQQSDFYFDFTKLDESFIKRLSICLHINHIFINQLVGYQITKITDMILSAGIPYEFFIHDFYCVCPRYNLLDGKYQYCNATKDITVCNKCLQSSLLCKDITNWRDKFSLLLKNAVRVTAPSNDTANIVSTYYPSLHIDVLEHDLPKYIRKTYDHEFENNKIFNVSVLGAIGPEKGARILDDLINLIAKEKLPIKITVIGYTDKYGEPHVSSDGMFEVTGKYDNREVSNLLAKYRTNVVLIPSIWPETYSYTVSEAIYSGYKVLAFDIGAPAERIKKNEMGWLVNDISANGIIKKIISLTQQNPFTC